jgi:nicotinamidase-related amidase
VIEVEGKTVYTTLQELVDPTHAALLVIDMQHDFVDPDGVFAGLGGDLSVYPPLIERLTGLIEAARTRNVPLVYTQHLMLTGLKSESPAQLRFNLRISLERTGVAAPLRYTVAGTWGAEIIPSLCPQEGEPIVTKHRSSGFWGTDLDMLLRSSGIETVLITGSTTEGCVESTARDALFNDYYVVVVEDCVGSDDSLQHDASLSVMRHRFDTASAAEIIATWERGPKVVATRPLAI